MKSKKIRERTAEEIREINNECKRSIHRQFVQMFEEMKELSPAEFKYIKEMLK